MRAQHFLAAGIVLGVISVIILQVYVSSTIAKNQDLAKARTVWKLVADVRAGKPLEAQQVKSVVVPEGYAMSLKGVVQKEELPLVVGKTLPRGATKDQYLLWSQFQEGLDKGRPDTLETVLEPGKRLITIPVERQGGSRGFIRPGDLVDLVGTFRPRADSSAKQEESWVFLQQVRVVATGGTTEYADAAQLKARGYGDITLEVKPDEAMAILWALENSAHIQVLLRNPKDRKELLDEDRAMNQTLFEKRRPKNLPDVPVANAAGLPARSGEPFGPGSGTPTLAPK